MRYYQIEDLKYDRYKKLYIDTLIEFIHESLNVIVIRVSQYFLISLLVALIQA